MEGQKKTDLELSQTRGDLLGHSAISENSQVGILPMHPQEIEQISEKSDGSANNKSGGELEISLDESHTQNSGSESSENENKEPESEHESEPESPKSDQSPKQAINYEEESEE